jgi:hypothetical protein
MIRIIYNIIFITGSSEKKYILLFAFVIVPTVWYYFIIHIKTNLFCSACYIYNHRVHVRIILAIYRFITIYAISAHRHKRCEFESRSGEVYSIQHYEIKLQ